MKLINGLVFFVLLTVWGFQPISSQAASAGSNALLDAGVNTRLKYWTFDPMVVSTSGNQPILLSIQADSATPGATISLEDGSVKQLLDEGNGKFSIELTHDEALVGEYRKYAGRNYVGQLDLSGGNTYDIWINIDNGSIPEAEVIDLDASTLISPRIVNFLIPHETPSQLDIKSITRLFYQYFPDEFDFINVVSTRASPLASHFANVKNTTLGLGLDLFDHTSDYGSSGRLEGVVRITDFSHFDLAGRQYLRMLGYNWMNYSEHPVLSVAAPHWPISTLASGIMGYHDQGRDGYNGLPYTFEPKLVGFPPGTWYGDYYLKPILNPPVYNSMERYLMGLIPASRVNGFFVLRNQRQTVCTLCELKGPLDYYDGESTLSVLGPRVPDASEARKNFKTATVVVSSDRLLSPQEIRHFDYMAARGEAGGQLASSRNDSFLGFTHPFSSASGGNGSLDAKIASNFATNINQGVSGSWYDANLPGQGFFVDVLPESGRVVIAWFTYDTSRSSEIESNMGDAYHRWMTAIGDFSENHAALKVYRTDGGVFNFDMPVENTEIGVMDFKIKDCENAEIQFDLHGGNWEGYIPLRRGANDNVERCKELQLPNADAEIAKAENAVNGIARSGEAGTHAETKNDNVISSEADSFQITAGLNGAWYNPDWPGQGFFIDVLPKEEKIFAGWFTFDTERLNESGPQDGFADLNQRWLTALGEYQGNQAGLELLLTSGGVFLSEEFTVTNQEYGTLDLEFIDCETATVRYNIWELGMSGVIPLKRVSSENTQTCELMATQATSFSDVTDAQRFE